MFTFDAYIFQSKFMTPHISFAIPSDDDHNSDAVDVIRDARGAIVSFSVANSTIFVCH